MAHKAPQDCQSKAGVSCDICFAPMPKVQDEHPAIASARAILQLHIDNIKMIDDGFVFHDKDGNNVNDKMRAACKEQIEMCNEIIDTAKDLRPELLHVLTPVMADAKATIEKALEDAKEPLLPEISDYDNDNPPASG